MRWSDSRMILGCGALGSVAAVLAFGASAAMLAPDLYLQVAQEDEIVEWATFWSLVVAGAVFLRRRWFGVALALFCFVVAMEEISWGQRLLGLRPPQYFLGHNYQQELNAHNLLPTIARKLAMSAVLAGYGIVLPLLRRWPRTRRSTETAGYR